MAIFAFITGIILGASLIACTVAAHNSDEIDEIISAGLATAKLAENYANRLLETRKKVLDHTDLLGTAVTTEILDIIDGKKEIKNG